MIKDASPQAAGGGNNQLACGGHFIKSQINLVSVARDSILGQKLLPTNIYMINIFIFAPNFAHVNF